jgi:hypothetical protein
MNKSRENAKWNRRKGRKGRKKELTGLFSQNRSIFTLQVLHIQSPAYDK